jgi:hypothetical protein
MIKTIVCKRILNLGNYESKHLEITYELGEGEEPGLQISAVMEMVERKIREDKTIQIVEEIAALPHELQIAGFRNELNQLRIENRKLPEKIADQAKGIAGLRHDVNQLKIKKQ